jgi:predicted permease
VQTFWQDLRYGKRMLTKAPGFTAVAVLTLALGIGANTAIFSLIEAILMRKLPVQDAKSLVVLQWGAKKAPGVHSSSSYGDCASDFSREAETKGCSLSQPFFNDVAAQTKSFSSTAAFAFAGRLDLSGNGLASLLQAQAVSGEYFPTLGIRPVAGRLIAPGDDSVSATPVVVLNYGYWKSEFGASPSAIGRTIRLNNVPFTIIGVAEPRFDSLSPGNVYDVWLPLSATPLLSPSPMRKSRSTDPASWWLVVIGRLKPGVAREQAQAEVSTLFRNEMLRGAKPLSKPDDDPKISLLPAQSGLTGMRDQFSTALYALMMAVGVVLLIACANVAGLLLSRAAARQKEMAVRLALGAGRARIVRQLMTESVMLSVIGGGLGILFAVWGTEAIVSLMANYSDRPLGFAPGVDTRVLAFAAGVSILTGIIFGLAPAFRGTRVDLTPALKEGSGGSLRAAHATGRWFTIGNALVVAQVALTIVILVGAGLVVRTLQNLKSVDPGFDTRNVLTFGLDPTLIGYKTPQVDAFYRDLQQRLSGISGVRSVSFSRLLLLSNGLWESSFHMRGDPKDKESQANYLPIGANFFSTMHMRLLAGRDFTSADYATAEVVEVAGEADRQAGAARRAAGSNAAPDASAKPAAIEAPTAVIVNEAFVRRYFPKVNPLGQQFGESEGDPETGEAKSSGHVAVGVVNDAKYQDLRSAVEPTMYVPSSGAEATFELLTVANPESFVPAVRSVVNQMDGNLPVFDIKTETEQIDKLLFQERLIARLASFFDLLALVLSCIGLYGLLSYEVARRTREIGIRMALGAQAADVSRLVVKQGIVLALVGAAAGTAVALGVTRYLSSMLFNVHANDPATIIAVAILLTMVALAACYIPARRATHVDPMVALRSE